MKDEEYRAGSHLSFRGVHDDRVGIVTITGGSCGSCEDHEDHVESMRFE
jgi:hypothetical protein